MIELEILFSSGQGILVPFEDREDALRFMKQAMDYDPEKQLSLYHLSTPYEELLIDFGDICFIRLKKENYPRLIGATLKIPERTSYHRAEDEALEREERRQEHLREARAKQERAAHQDSDGQTFTVDLEGNVADPEQKRQKHRHDAEEKLKQSAHPDDKDERHFTVDPEGAVKEDPLTQKFEQAEKRLKQAEKRLDEVDRQRQKVEAQLKQTSEELEDAVREAELRKKIEDIEISEEINAMKEKNHD